MDFGKKINLFGYNVSYRETPFGLLIRIDFKKGESLNDEEKARLSAKITNYLITEGFVNPPQPPPDDEGDQFTNA